MSGLRSRTRRVVLVPLLVTASMLGACTLLTSLDGFTGGTTSTEPDGAAPADGPLDAPARDAPSDTSSLDAGDEAGVNLYPGGGTLDGTCAPFNAFQGTITPTTTAHSGAGGCRVCTVPATTDYFTADDNSAFGTAKPGDHFRASVWVRAEVGKPTPQNVQLDFRAIVFNPNYNAVGFASSPSITVDASWQRLETTYTFDQTANLNIYVAGAHAAGACFVIDDVTLERLP